MMDAARPAWDKQVMTYSVILIQISEWYCKYYVRLATHVYHDLYTRQAGWLFYFDTTSADTGMNIHLVYLIP